MHNHQTALELANMAAVLTATNGSRDEAIAKLVSAGGDELRAALGVDLLPIAFGWAAMAKMGVRRFPESLVLRVVGADDVEFPISACPLFTTAHEIATDIFSNGFTDLFPQSVVQALCFGSADVKAVMKAVDKDKSLDLGQIEFTSILFGYTPENIEEAGRHD